MRKTQAVCIGGLIAALLAAPTRLAAEPSRIVRPGVVLAFESITTDYARALADICEAARGIAVDQFGWDLPDTLHVRIEVNWQTGPCLFTNGQDAIVLRLSGSDQIRRAAEHDVHFLYGFCRAVGELAFERAVGRDAPLRATAREGWGHYSGSLLLDAVIGRLGPLLWPDRSDDYRTGVAVLVNQLHESDVSPIVRAAGEWKALDEILGRRPSYDVPGIVASWFATPASTTSPTLNALATERFGEWKKRAAIWAMRERVAPDPTALPSAEDLSGQPITLLQDDGRADGSHTLDRTGHVVRFQAPAGEWYLRTIWAYVKRDGYTSLTHNDIQVWLCDEQMHAIGEFRQWDTRLRRGPARWHRFGVPPVVVPGRFFVCIQFGNRGSRGVNVYLDSSRRGDSFVGLPGRMPEPWHDGNWMIRVGLDRLREHDPLRPPDPGRPTDITVPLVESANDPSLTSRP